MSICNLMCGIMILWVLLAVGYGLCELDLLDWIINKGNLETKSALYHALWVVLSFWRVLPVRRRVLSLQQSLGWGYLSKKIQFRKLWVWVPVRKQRKHWIITVERLKPASVWRFPSMNKLINMNWLSKLFLMNCVVLELSYCHYFTTC